VEKYVEEWYFKSLIIVIYRGVIIDNMYIKDVLLAKDLQEALSSAATE